MLILQNYYLDHSFNFLIINPKKSGILQKHSGDITTIERTAISVDRFLFGFEVKI